MGTVPVSVGVSNVPEKTPRGAPTLVATDHPRDDSTVTGWMFLGCLRECFRRNRTARRRDEDVETDERKSAAPTP